MRVEIGARRFAKARDHKRELLRKATTEATSKRGINGAVKSKRLPKPITLPKLKCLEDE
jgi:hypothetical protein